MPTSRGETTRSIFVLPRFANQEAIEAVRNQFDPLATKVPPHITLVHPFKSDLSTQELRLHVTQSVSSVRPFHLKMQGVTGNSDGWLFLNVKAGNDTLIQLRDLLYTGPLQQFLYRKISYLPHVTVGRVPVANLDDAFIYTKSLDESFETWVNQVYVERIDDDECSQIVFSVALD